MTASRASLSDGAFTALVSAAALATLWLPLHLLLVGPLVLGVPHVVGDVRALVLQRPGGFGGRAALASLAALALMTALRGATMAGAALPPELELGAGLLAVLLAILVDSHPSRRRTLALSASLALGGIALAAPRTSTVLLAHAHNFLALALWLALARGRARAGLALAVFALALAFVVALPLAVPAPLGAFRWEDLASTLAPGLTSDLADRVVRSFAFAQLVHYALWCGPLPYAKGSSLRSEAGLAGVAVAVLASIALPLAGLFDAPAVRSLYLSLAVAHGWLELSLLGFLVSRGRVLS